MANPEPPASAQRPRGPIIAAGVVAAVVVVGVVLAIVLVNRGGSDVTSTPTAASTPTALPRPTPTPESVLWAGQVCSDIERVKSGVSGLGRNLDYDVTADASALEQIQRQLTVQVLAVGDAIDRLNMTLVGVPLDETEAVDFANTLSTSGADTKEAVDAVRMHLSAAADAQDVLTAVAEIGQALVAGKAAYEAGSTFVSLIGDATSSATGRLQESFRDAPQCAAVTG